MKSRRKALPVCVCHHIQIRHLLGPCAVELKDGTTCKCRAFRLQKPPTLESVKAREEMKT